MYIAQMLEASMESLKAPNVVVDPLEHVEVSLSAFRYLDTAMPDQALSRELEQELLNVEQLYESMNFISTAMSAPDVTAQEVEMAYGLYNAVMGPYGLAMATPNLPAVPGKDNKEWEVVDNKKAEAKSGLVSKVAAALRAAADAAMKLVYRILDAVRNFFIKHMSLTGLIIKRGNTAMAEINKANMEEFSPPPLEMATAIIPYVGWAVKSISFLKGAEGMTIDDLDFHNELFKGFMTNYGRFQKELLMFLENAAESVQGSIPEKTMNSLATGYARVVSFLGNLLMLTENVKQAGKENVRYSEVMGAGARLYLKYGRVEGDMYLPSAPTLGFSYTDDQAKQALNGAVRGNVLPPSAAKTLLMGGLSMLGEFQKFRSNFQEARDIESGIKKAADTIKKVAGDESMTEAQRAVAKRLIAVLPGYARLATQPMELISELAVKAGGCCIGWAANSVEQWPAVKKVLEDNKLKGQAYAAEQDAKAKAEADKKAGK